MVEKNESMKCQTNIKLIYAREWDLKTENLFMHKELFFTTKTDKIVKKSYAVIKKSLKKKK